MVEQNNTGEIRNRLLSLCHNGSLLHLAFGHQSAKRRPKDKLMTLLCFLSVTAPQRCNANFSAREKKDARQRPGHPRWTVGLSSATTTTATVITTATMTAWWVTWIFISDDRKTLLLVRNPTIAVRIFFRQNCALILQWVYGKKGMNRHLAVLMQCQANVGGWQALSLQGWHVRCSALIPARRSQHCLPPEAWNSRTFWGSTASPWQIIGHRTRPLFLWKDLGVLNLRMHRHFWNLYVEQIHGQICMRSTFSICRWRL